MILDTIARSAGKRVEQRKQVKSLEQMMKAACECREREGIKGDAIKRAGIKRENGTNEVHPFKAALSKPGVSFICEVKKASPSKGLIAPDFPYVEIARQYQEAGADAVSVLTEPEFFLGADRYLEEIHREIELPLLRKDFIVDEYQIYEAKVLGASAVLLICSLMDMEKLKRYMGICGSLGLSSLVEAHTDREVAMAAEAGSDIIGINNRNLETFEVDFTNALRLRKLVDRGTIFVAESGIRTP
ncbi:MAG: indole-3-glycerol phosphate synthase TrpC, partial [Enterocloster sp.]|nr:indole-3-glycerol phosphate synthase TrpC [Enterocloster sp.]